MKRRTPTPEQIAKRAARIRANWSDAEHARRARCGGAVRRDTVRVALSRSEVANVEGMRG